MRDFICYARLSILSTMNPDAQSGFDCDLVEKPPKAVQSECPVCLLIIRKPYQATCCGYSYCKHCIQRIKARNHPCPCCKTKRFEIFEDKRLERSLYELTVHCSNKSQGCQWVGDLRQLDNHINANPSKKELLEGCKCTQVACLYCDTKERRSSIQTHQNDLCPKRPFRCAYCNQYASDYEDVCSKHWLKCGYYPVPCTNKCGVSIPRSYLEHHTSKECSRTKIDCYFKHTGCNVKLMRQDMQAHLDKSHPLKEEEQLGLVKLREYDYRKHGKLALGHSWHQQRTKSQDHENRNSTLGTKLTADQKEQVEENKNIITCLMIVMACGFFYFYRQTVVLQNNVAVLTQEVFELRNHASVCPMTITMANFTQYYDKDKAWLSPPFYTHPRGYKMCLKVYAKGYGEAKGTHISVSMFMMQGEFDSELRWPFRGRVTVQLLNRTEVFKPFEPYKPKTYHFDGKESANRVIERDRANKGVVYQKFVQNETKLRFFYLKYDSLKFSLKYKP